MVHPLRTPHLLTGRAPVALSLSSCSRRSALRTRWWPDGGCRVPQVTCPERGRTSRCWACQVRRAATWIPNSMKTAVCDIPPCGLPAAPAGAVPAHLGAVRGHGPMQGLPALVCGRGRGRAGVHEAESHTTTWCPSTGSTRTPAPRRASSRKRLSC